MAAVTYQCPVDPDCPPSPRPGFCSRHPTVILKRARVGFVPVAETDQASDASAPRSTDERSEAQAGPSGRRSSDNLLSVRLLGETVTVPPEGLEIGRDAPQFADVPGMAALDQVSRHHVRLQYQGDALLALDLGSTNGTFVENRRITGPEQVRPGQTLRLGLDVHIEIDRVRLDPFGLPE